MKLNKDEFFERLTKYIGDDSSDEAISFMEDMGDTYNHLEELVNKGDDEDWEKKYYENDEAWKKRYRERFFGGHGGETKTSNEVFVENKEIVDFNDIFEEDITNAH